MTLVQADSVLEYIFDMVRAPLFNSAAIGGLALSNLDLSMFPWRETAFGLIIFKTVHFFLAEIVRLYVATRDLSYIGDLFTSDYVQTEVTTLDDSIIGSFLVQVFIIPFLH